MFYLIKLIIEFKKKFIIFFFFFFFLIMIIIILNNNIYINIFDSFIIIRRVFTSSFQNNKIDSNRRR